MLKKIGYKEGYPDRHAYRQIERHIISKTKTLKGPNRGQKKIDIS